MAEHGGWPIAYPAQRSPARAVGPTARFAIARQLVIGAGYSNTSLRGSMAYGVDTSSEFGDWVLSHWDATMVWAVAYWNPAFALRLRGGLAWYRLENIPGGQGLIDQPDGRGRCRTDSLPAVLPALDSRILTTDGSQ